MIKTIKIKVREFGLTDESLMKEVEYKVTDEETIDANEELIFEYNNNDEIGDQYCVAMFDDMLGYPIKKVWKIIE
jgi:hypothetical protein